MDARTQVDTPVVGALAVLAAVREKWGLREVVDQVAPTKGDVSVGTLVEVMVLNRLLNPQAMDAVGEWAAGAAVTDLDGLTADQLNDDRLGRLRETVAEHGPSLPSAASLSIVVRKDSRGTHRRLSPIQREILKLLDLPDKVLQTFKRRCGT